MKHLRKHLGTLVAAIVASAILFIPSQLLATPYFSLQTQNDWQSALNDGRITPVSASYDALEAHYGVPGTNFIQVTPELMALNDSQSGYGDGLLMHWGNPASDLPQVATWQYNYPLDPNLVGTLLTLTIMPPPHILSVSLTLNDAAGGWVSWDWNVAGPFGPGPLIAGQPNTITLNPSLLAPQAGSTSFATIGFNPVIATTIQADELAIGANGWAAFPPVPVVGGAKAWNYWSGLTVKPVPVPAAVILLGSGVLGLAGFRKRLSRK